MSFEELFSERTLLFWDIETSGLDSDSQLYTIGYSINFQSTCVDQFFEYDDPVAMERGVLEKFLDVLEKDKKWLFVTFAGSKYDVPFLTTKCLKYGYDALSLWNAWHLDLMFLWMKMMRTGRSPMTFKAMSKALGIDHEDKYGGSLMSYFYRKGEYNKIVSHNRADVDLLKKVYIKTEPICKWNLKRRYYQSKVIRW